MGADKPMRVASDLHDLAVLEGARENRSAKQQLEHWTRVGLAVSLHATTSRRRIEAAVADTRELRSSSVEERVVANAEIDATIQEHLPRVSYTDMLAAEGVTTVSLDDDGNLVERHPDGTTTLIG